MSAKAASKWSIDFNEGKRTGHRGRSDDLAAPPGFIPHIESSERSEDEEDSSLVAKQGWSMALAPWKQLPMNLFVMWMAGNTVSIFPIMMVGMMFVRPMQTLVNLREPLSKFRGDQAIFQKAIFVLANFMGILLAVYKFNSMGLLPTHKSDWLEFQEPQQIMELSGGGYQLT